MIVMMCVSVVLGGIGVGHQEVVRYLLNLVHYI